MTSYCSNKLTVPRCLFEATHKMTDTTVITTIIMSSKKIHRTIMSSRIIPSMETSAQTEEVSADLRAAAFERNNREFYIK